MTAEAIDRQFKTEVATAIKNKNDIAFITYAGLSSSEEKIKFVLASILEMYNRGELFTPLLSCIKELIANATKANAKLLLIHEGKIHNPEDPVEVVKQIRSVLNEKALLEYSIKAKKRHLSTRTYLKRNRDNLIIEVINNVPLTPKEHERIMNKIESSSKYDNIADFYMENPDPEAEGMGLGLSMIVVLLKNINISHKNFQVTTDQKNKTFARILVPLT